jgi:hypothetical protein
MCRFGPLLAVDARGDALMAWGVDQKLRVSYRTAGGEWQQPTRVSRPGEGVDSSPEIALDDHGRALILWNASRPSSGGRFASRFEVVSRDRAGFQATTLTR